MSKTMNVLGIHAHQKLMKTFNRLKNESMNGLHRYRDSSTMTKVHAKVDLKLLSADQQEKHKQICADLFEEH